MKPLQNMKIRIRDAGHSEQVQECLFQLGYKWYGQVTPTVWLPKERNNLFTYTGGRIFCETDECHFVEHSNTEVTLEDLQAMLDEPDEIPEGSSADTVETASVSVPTFSLDNTVNAYISQIQKRLADTNLSVSIYGDEIRVANMDTDAEVGVKSWEGVLEIIKVKQAYLNVFKGD